MGICSPASDTLLITFKPVTLQSVLLKGTVTGRCWTFQRDKSKVRTIYGITNAIGVSAFQCCTQSSNVLPYFCPLHFCPTELGFSTGAITRARHLLTLISWGPCLFSSSASELPTASHFVPRQPGSRFSLWLLQVSPSLVFLCQVVHTISLSLLVSKCLDGFCTSPVELQPWAHLIKMSSHLQYEHGALGLCFCNSIIFQMHLQFIIPSNPQILVCLASSP